MVTHGASRKETLAVVCFLGSAAIGSTPQWIWCSLWSDEMRTNHTHRSRRQSTQVKVVHTSW